MAAVCLLPPRVRLLITAPTPTAAVGGGAATLPHCRRPHLPPDGPPHGTLQAHGRRLPPRHPSQSQPHPPGDLPRSVSASPFLTGRWPYRRRLTIWSITASPGGSRFTAAR